ncbi:magnesium chelatase [Trinickia caryophylli]|uniref:Magnesium chelatase subunit ChlD-like protein n=1 Tax=Trinickia caryophylli TaxID=28094 RepID=A0A1X7GIE5_TRICW|nr:magnesium chelatase [Trinickia caryophylli]PMS09873.1 magnesium chelatase [Trinickia caryophylli]TRX14908.1 magnesium chelatase [Trinickia caryophylli]WQE14758.1 magnesium chelatase [Trinickia caryophylli]SMF70224.1 magnesium chelatase subunit ChlD-like protein [Trinickia caryophylli]GLU34957.1 hypothetical protein Busp01_47990 [Trinickia caryophylli]
MPSARIAWLPTLARKRDKPLSAGHLRFAAMESRAGVLHCFLLDCSASMLGDEGLKTAKGLLLASFDRAAALREQAALICFGGAGTALRFGPAVPRWWNERWLRPIGAGGGTPFSRGIAAASQLLERARARQPQLQCVLWIFTDGRSSEQPVRPKSADRIVFVDCERGRLRLERCRTLAAAWGAECVGVDEIIGAPSASY